MNKIYYQLEIYKITDKNKYDIYFLKSKGDRNIENYGTDVKTVLADNKINYDADNKYFMASKFTEASLISTLKKICSEFNKL